VSRRNIQRILVNKTFCLKKWQRWRLTLNYFSWEKFKIFPSNVATTNTRCQVRKNVAFLSSTRPKQKNSRTTKRSHSHAAKYGSEQICFQCRRLADWQPEVPGAAKSPVFFFPHFPGARRAHAGEEEKNSLGGPPGSGGWREENEHENTGKGEFFLKKIKIFFFAVPTHSAKKKLELLIGPFRESGRGLKHFFVIIRGISFFFFLTRTLREFIFISNTKKRREGDLFILYFGCVNLQRGKKERGRPREEFFERSTRHLYIFLFPFFFLVAFWQMKRGIFYSWNFSGDLFFHKKLKETHFHRIGAKNV
jgi:hypothetical protein